MCGRYTHRYTWSQIVELYRLSEPAIAPNEFVPRYNIAPTQKAPVVRERDGKRELAMLRWGLIPYWSKDAKIAYKTINARAETVATAPSFREAPKMKRITKFLFNRDRDHRLGNNFRFFYMARCDSGE
jgi:putative SOS response-associated peptidase YedK